MEKIDQNEAVEETLDEEEEQEEQNVEGEDADLQILPTFANGKEVASYMRDLPKSMAATGKTRSYSRVFKLLKSRDMLPIELQSVRTYSVMNAKQHAMLTLVLESITNADTGLLERLHCAVHNIKYQGKTPSMVVSAHDRRDYATLLAKAMAGGILPREVPSVTNSASNAPITSRQADLQAEQAANQSTVFLSAPTGPHTATTSSSNNGSTSSNAEQNITTQAQATPSKKQKTHSPQEQKPRADTTTTSSTAGSMANFLQSSAGEATKSARKLQKKIILAELEQSLLQKRKDGDIANLRAALSDPALDFDLQERKKMKTKLLELMGVSV